MKILKNYNLDKISIATLGSHSALNILRGAKDEGFRTVCICRKNERLIYDSFGVADVIIEIEDFPDLLRDNIQHKLIEMNAILIPHGSFNAYLDNLDKIKVPLFGNKELMLWEVDREKQSSWLKMAGLRVPKTYRNPEEVDKIAIVKCYGAKGGRGYFLITGKDDFYRKIEIMKKLGFIEFGEKYQLQEYIVGTNIYFSFFNSLIFNRVELIAIDRRYESNVDGIGRIPADVQLKTDLIPTYTVTGNIPLVLREKFLEKAIRAAVRVVEVSKKIASPGLIGPFCLECSFDENGEMYVFEISARIVAGTNVGIPVSPYSYILFGENMYMGRRIAREIKMGIETGKLEELLC